MVWGGNDNAVEKWIDQLLTNDPKLVSLHILSFRQVSSAQLAAIFSALAQNTTLKELYCSGHALDADAVEQLAEALTLNDTLQILNIGDANFGTADDGKLVRILSEGLAVNEGLVTLDLENKGLTKESASHIFRALSANNTLTSLSLARNNLTSLPDCSELTLNSLRELNLAMNNIDAAGARNIAAQLPRLALEHLNVSDNPLLDGANAIGEALRENTTLRILKLSNVAAVEEVLELPPTATTPTGQLQEIAPKIDEEQQTENGNALMRTLAQSLRCNSTIQQLWLDSNGIDVRGLAELGQLENSALVELRLRNNRIDDDGAIALAANFKSLRTIELGENTIGPIGLGALLETSFEYVGLFSNKVGGFGASLDLLPTLETSGVVTLDMGCNGMKVEDLEAMVQILQQGGVPKLKLLEIGGNAQDRDMEAWEQLVAQLESIRPQLRVAWKRSMSQMPTENPPPLNGPVI
ncbi:uncharacterized protein BYT42DRAFT_574485 [Radiomyces spectabilis]|uniref:uncharacterized protein n=1 Tax=Radiomyces spectabilis TaxID=64574 RepID=UPI00222064FD|nr:uncharacterized protein BYT42DRAFT_574485 [Radiomyces spectabilis]KAI8376410.1 hypothetical protein BYT42DRAFT_574485 [Radiomyces spectabilis]